MSEDSTTKRVHPSTLTLRHCTAAVALAAGLLLGCAPPPPACPAKKYEAPDERFVFFALAKTDVPADGFFTIGFVASQLEADPAMHVLIVGHADSQGKSEAHRELSLKRARAVRKVLVDHGVKEKRILIAAPREGGESSLAQLHRRVDLFVYDPVQDEATKRLGYTVDVKSE
jgi:hypothetical protein